MVQVIPGYCLGNKVHIVERLLAFYFENLGASKPLPVKPDRIEKVCVFRTQERYEVHGIGSDENPLVAVYFYVDKRRRKDILE